MIFALLVSFLGSLIVIRMFESVVESHLFDRTSLTKIGTGYVCAVVTLAALVPRSHIWIWFSVITPVSGVSLLMWMLVRKRKSEFQDAIGEVLALVSLKMKTGLSFRQAFSEVTAESSPLRKTKLAEIFSAVVFSQQVRRHDSDPFISDVIDELARIDQLPHAAARRIDSLREKLRIESDFRRRSGQVLARIRAQSLVMTAMFFAVASFVGWKFGFVDNLRIFSLATVLYAAGSAWIWCGGRNLKWKV